MHFGNAMCRVLNEKSNITASIAEQLKDQGNMTFTNALWVGNDKLHMERG